MDLVLVEDCGGREDGHLAGDSLVLDNRSVDVWSVKEVLVLVIFDFCILWDHWNGDVACNHPLHEWLLTPAAGWLQCDRAVRFA